MHQLSLIHCLIYPTASFNVSSALSNRSGPTGGTACSFRIPTGTDFVYFSAFAGAAAIFFFLAFFVFLPFLILTPAKFALSFTFGSACTMAAFNMLSGWQASLRHMISSERLPFSAAYVGSMLATVYAALIMKSYLFSLIFCGGQVCCSPLSPAFCVPFVSSSPHPLHDRIQNGWTLGLMNFK